MNCSDALELPFGTLLFRDPATGLFHANQVPGQYMGSGAFFVGKGKLLPNPDFLNRSMVTVPVEISRTWPSPVREVKGSIYVTHIALDLGHPFVTQHLDVPKGLLGPAYFDLGAREFIFQVGPNRIQVGFWQSRDVLHQFMAKRFERRAQLHLEYVDSKTVGRLRRPIWITELVGHEEWGKTKRLYKGVWSVPVSCLDEVINMVSYHSLAWTPIRAVQATISAREVLACNKLAYLLD